MNLIKISQELDSIADDLEKDGYDVFAAYVDAVADVVQMSDLKLSPETRDLAREMGVPLNIKSIFEFVKKNYDPKMDQKTALKLSPKMRQLGILAAMLMNALMGLAQGRDITIRTDEGTKSFSKSQLEQMQKTKPDEVINVLQQYFLQQDKSDVEAKKYQEAVKELKSFGNKSVTLQTQFGPRTYNSKSLKELSQDDKKTFIIIMDQIRQKLKGPAQRVVEKGEKPAENAKTVKNVEELSDAFGNKAQEITFNDGSIELKGDYYHTPGKSYRKYLEDKKKINPNEGKTLPPRG